MKVRLWVLIAVFIAGLMAVSLYLGWRRARINQRVETFFLSQISAMSGAQVSVRGFHMGLGYVRLTGVTIVDEMRGFSLIVDQARLGFSLVDHVTGGFRTAAGLTEVLLSRPRLRVDVDRFSLAKDRGSPGLFALQEDLPDRITVVNGSIVLVSAGNDRRSQVTEIDGWLEMVADQTGSFRWSGSWGGGGVKNMLGSGTFGHLFETFSLRAELQEANLVDVLGSAFLSRYRIDQGLLRFSLTADKSSKNRKTELQGRLGLEVVDLIDEKLGVCIEGLSAQARLEGLDVVVERVEAGLESGEVRARGRIAHLLKPTCHLVVGAEDLEAAPLLAKILSRPTEQMPRGSVNLKGILEGSGENLAFRGQVSASELEVSGHHLGDLRAHLAVGGSYVQVKGLETRLPWAAFRLHGKLDLAQFPAAVAAEWCLDDVDLAKVSEQLNLGTVRGKGVLAGKLGGSVDSPNLRGGLQLSRLRGSKLPVGEIKGQFHWGAGRLTYRLESPDGRVLLEGGGMGWSKNSGHQAVLHLRNMPLRRILGGQEGGKEGAKLSGQWIFSGSAAQAKVMGEAELGGIPGMRGHFDSWGEFSLKEQGQWCLEAEAVSRNWEIQDIPVSMRLAFSLDEQQLQLRELNLNDQLRVFGVMETGGSRNLEGQLTFSQADARWLSGLALPHLAQGHVEGLISGRLEVAGTAKSPKALGEMEWIHGRFGRLEDLSWHLPLWLSDGTLHLGSALLSRQDHRLMVLTGKADAKGTLSFQAWGERIEARAIAQLFDQISPEVSGVLDFHGQIGGSLRSPIFEGQMQWFQGQLKGVDFDELQVGLRGEKGRLRLERFTIAKSDERRIFITGSIPYTALGFSKKSVRQEEMDISVEIGGDVLSLLPPFTSLVKEASGRGQASFRLGGTPDALVLGSGRLLFQEGRMKPAIFFKELEDLDGWLEIDDEDQFVEIKELVGTVEGSSLEVSNLRELESDGGSLEPLGIPGLGLNLGILGIKTGEDGVEANVPGLMAVGEMGKIRLTDIDAAGPLIIAGPLESPRVFGMLGLNHLDFTYPPSSSDEGAHLSFLSQVRWDLMLVALKDVWYHNDFANLRVKDTRSQLHFTGSGEEGTLCVVGHAEADRGDVTYLDRRFQVVKMELDFEGHEKSSGEGYDNRPHVAGQFKTTVYSESTGVATDIFITLYAIDPETGERTLRGKWGDYKLELSSSDPSDDTQERVLAKLGYTGDWGEQGDKALQFLQVTLGPKLENRFIRPVIEPVERTIKRALGIDVVRFQPGLARNLLVQDRRPPGATESLSRQFLFPRSSLLIGEYVTDSCFLSYLGKFQTRTDEYLDDRLGIIHRFGMEFRLRGSTMLDFEYDYESDLTEGDKKARTTSDKRVQITHNFPF